MRNRRRNKSKKSRQTDTVPETKPGFKEIVHEILEPDRGGNRASRIFDLFMLTLITLNVLAIILETVPSIKKQLPHFFPAFEIFSVCVFSVELLLRLWCCNLAERYRHPVLGRLRFLFTPLPLIDLIAILPFYLPFFGIDLRFARVLRLFRIFRLAKIGRYSRAMRTLGRVLVSRRAELILTLFILVVLLIFASSLMYYAERDVQPENFPSIPATMWWSVVTLTTVGYGDVYPVTHFGKVLAGIIAVLGIGLFALPNGIIAVAFIEQLQAKQKKSQVCPHCGKHLES